MPDDDDIDILVCAPADAEFITPGSIFDQRCARCARRVAIAPSGQRLLKEKALEIICASCAFAPGGLPADADHELAAPIEDIISEFKDRIPNPRRRRN